jgi:hypothetical protein
MQLIRSKYLSTHGSYRPMDLARKAQFFTLDVISDIGFGKPFGDLANDEDMFKYAESAEFGFWIMLLTTATGFQKLFRLEWLAKLAAPSEKDKNGFGRMLA